VTVALPITHTNMKLNAKAFGLAAGIFWGLGLGLLTLISIITGGFGNTLLYPITELYIGYEVSYLGALIGLIYGFVDGFIGCYIFAALYNLLAGKKK